MAILEGFETASHYIEQLHADIFIPPPLASRQVFNLHAVVIPEREPAVGQHDLFAVVPNPDQQPQFAFEPLYVLCIVYYFYTNFISMLYSNLSVRFA